MALIDLPNGNKDLVVANSGANEILLYPGILDANGNFSGNFRTPTAYATGEDPVGITIASLTASGKKLELTGEIVDEDLIFWVKRMATLFFQDGHHWTLESIDNHRASDTSLATVLIKAGFQRHGDKLILWKH